MPDGLQQFAVRMLEAHCRAARDGDWPHPGEVNRSRFQTLRQRPSHADGPLLTLAGRLALSEGEVLATALCLAADSDPQVARLVARAQEPVGGSRPLVGLVCTLFEAFGLSPARLAAGAAVRARLLIVGDEAAALPERALSMALPLVAALSGQFCPPPGVTRVAVPLTPLPAQLRERARAEAAWLGEEGHGFIVRSASHREKLAIVGSMADALGRVLVILSADEIALHAAWLLAANALPCVMVELGPGAMVRLPPLGAYCGPLVMLAGSEGAVETGLPQREWRLPLPDEAERIKLWRAGGVDIAAAKRAARSYRQGAGRIAELCEQARNDVGSETIGWSELSAAVVRHRSSLDSLAHKLVAHVGRDDLVLPPHALAGLDLLLARIVNRSDLAAGLGGALAARYRPGVRALFTGDSGTGKSLAAHWLAAQTGLPLYRVDQAALTSKWIGETEKNLSAVLDAAQHADVILFFDEADALFGKRTDVSDAHDRHANAQTNYLLQRIEDFEGVVILASNGRDRFDPAFSRRLDLILPFPMPDVTARDALWRTHLGAGHTLDDRQLGGLALAVELAGGHIRNIVLGAAVRARLHGRPIGLADIEAALADECSKLGRVTPAIGA